MPKIGKRKKIRMQVRTHQGTSPKYYAACYGKIRYNTRQEAEKAANDLSTACKAYRCEFCPYFHKGRRPK